MLNKVFRNGLVVSIILLFLGVGIQPSVATIQPEIKIHVEPKDYLFQTIIDIANNPEVKELIKSTKINDLFCDCDYNLRNIYRKILFKNPGLFNSLIFTKSSITYEYLDKCYNKGLKYIDVLDDDKTFEIIELIEIINPELLDKINKIISNDEELSNKITTLKEMNQEYVSDLEWDFPIFCNILETLFYAYMPVYTMFVILYMLPCWKLSDMIPIYCGIMFIMMALSSIPFSIILQINYILDCFPFGPWNNDPPYPPSDPYPDDGAKDVGVNTELSVKVTDPEDDYMRVYFYDGSDDSLIGSDLSVPSGERASITWSNLTPITNYRWYVVAEDFGELSTISDIWLFTTSE